MTDASAAARVRRVGWAGPPVLANAWLHAVSCHHEPALDEVERVRAQARAVGDTQLAAEAEMVAAVAFINVGEAARCLARVTRALESPSTSDDAGFRGWATSLAGAALLALDRVDEGLETLANAEVLLRETRVAEPRVAHAYGTIGRCRTHVHLFAAAAESYHLALQIDRALGLAVGSDLHGRAENLLFWAMRLEHLGDLDQARRRAAESVRAFAAVLHEPADNGPHAERCLAPIGAALAGCRPLGEGSSTDPAGDLEKARAAAAECTMPESATWLAHATAAVRLRLGDPAEALACVDHVPTAPDEPRQPLLGDRLFTASTCHQALGNTAAAFTLYKAFHRHSDLAAFAAQQARGDAALDRVDGARAAEDYAQRARGSVTDPLTGVANRQRFDARLDELLVAAGPGRPLALAVIDVDDVHTVNEQHGRRTGDEVLRAVASMLDRDTVPHDLVARLGRDEFAMLCPGMDHGASRMLRDAVGSAIASYPWDVLTAPGLRVRVSIGLAVWSPGTRAEDLLDRAYADLAEHAPGRTAPPASQPSFDARTAS